MELVISVVIGILIVEAYVWLPKISEWLIERAVQCLRSEDQDRCREEWKAGLDALPNTVIKLVHAFSILALHVGSTLTVSKISSRKLMH